MREQFWLLPSGEDGRSLRATVFRPADRGRPGTALPRQHPVVVINHGTSEQHDLRFRMPVYYWLSRWFVEQGYIVVLPQRRGHGATGGTLAEGSATAPIPIIPLRPRRRRRHRRRCELSAAQPFVAKSDIVVAGISTGGWASLALPREIQRRTCRHQLLRRSRRPCGRDAQRRLQRAAPNPGRPPLR